MSTNIDFFLESLHVLVWIIFIGLCIESGGILTNAVVSLFVYPTAAKNFWGGMNLYQLSNHFPGQFIAIISVLFTASFLKSVLFYLLVNLFHQKKLNFTSPFNETFGRYIFKLSYIALGVGLVSYWGKNFSNWLKFIGSKNISPDLFLAKFEGADVWIFLGIILLVFALIFKKGIELQSDNELTI